MGAIFESAVHSIICLWVGSQRFRLPWCGRESGKTTSARDRELQHTYGVVGEMKCEGEDLYNFSESP